VTGPGPLGAVLAGGGSRRYGSDKSAAPVGGVPMVQRVLAAASTAVDEVVVVSSRPVAGAPEAERIEDRVPDRGPLGGLHAALHEARSRGRSSVLLLACDLPLVSGALLRALVAEADGETVAPAREDGSAEVLCAVWSVEALGTAERHLRSDDRSLQSLFGAVGGRLVDRRGLPAAGPHVLLNVNTAEARERAVDGLGPLRNGRIRTTRAR